MAQKVKAQKFDAIDKRTIKGRAGHSRTGACRAKGRCTCAKRKMRGGL